MSKLSVLPTVFEAFALQLRYFTSFWHLVWIPFLCGAVLRVWFSGIPVISDIPFAGDFVVSSLADFLVPVIPLLPVLVAWHRVIINGEVDDGALIDHYFASEARLYIKKLFGFGLLTLALSPLVWIYGFFIGGWITVRPFVQAAKYLFDRETAVNLEGWLIVHQWHMIFPALIVAWFLVRRVLVLPSAALGLNMSHRTSITHMRGNELRVLATILITVSPLMATEMAMVLLQLETDVFAHNELFWALYLAGLLASWTIELVVLAALVGALSLVYRHLVAESKESPTSVLLTRSIPV